MRDGQYIVVTSGGTLERLDARGRVLKSFSVGAVYTLGGSIDVLPGGLKSTYGTRTPAGIAFYARLRPTTMARARAGESAESREEEMPVMEHPQ